VVAAAVAVHAVTGQETYPIGTSQAVAALSAKGIAVPGEDVSMTANVVASQPHPALEVLAAGSISGSEVSQRASGSRFWVKLGCQVAGVCLPFYALVTLPAVDVSPWIDGLRSMASASAKPKISFAVQAGARATLILEDGRSRVEMPVVALERGVIGSEIRVATPDRKNSYRVTVVGPGLLKGSL
jgi:hypothetical protein